MPSRIARPTARARYYDTPDGTVITPCVTTAIRDSDFAPPVFFYTPAKDPRNEFNNNVYGRVKHGRVIIIIAAVLRTTTVYSRRPPPPGHGTYALVVLDAGHAVLICLEIRLLRTLRGVCVPFFVFSSLFADMFITPRLSACSTPHPLSLQWTRARARKPIYGTRPFSFGAKNYSFRRALSSFREDPFCDDHHVVPGPRGSVLEKPNVFVGRKRIRTFRTTRYGYDGNSLGQMFT